MVYLVTNQQELFTSDEYTIISIEESLRLLNSCKVLQYDSETSGRNARICDILCIQFGNKKADFQIVVDVKTVNILLYKEILETKLIIGQNLKFDLQFLYNYKIIPTDVYDTMIVEQLLYLGYPPGQFSFALNAIAERRLGVNIDKSVRGEIIWRGLDTSVILYAAGDVTYLEDIMEKQIEDCYKKDCIKGAKLECDFVPVIAYLEWSGIKLDVNKWTQKMLQDQQNLNNALASLNEFVTKIPSLSSYVFVETQGSLFEGFNTAPQISINWSSSQQVVKVAKILGFDTGVKDKKTGEDKDSVIEKHLKGQKGINDEFLKLYFDYQEYFKVVTSFGQGHLNAVNPKTGRIHTIYRQLGAASGRMSCGSSQFDTDLAKLKKLPARECTFPNIQQLPSDHTTRSCFVAEKGNLWVSCDWSAAEARLAGDIYNDQAIKDIFLNDIDSHSMYAKIFFKEELKDIDVRDIKKLRPDLRSRSKGPEFALNFGGGKFAIMQSLQCTEEEANTIIKNYEEGFAGTKKFAIEGSKLLRKRGYVLMNPDTGHKMYWWDFDVWKNRQDSFTSAFWEEYKAIHKGSGDSVEQSVKQHFKASSKWDRMVRNAPTQGTCCIILKDSQIDMFNWIVKNGYFGKVLLCALVHDEANWEYPEHLEDVPKMLKYFMEKSADKYCKSLPIPADVSIGDHWIH